MHNFFYYVVKQNSASHNCVQLLVTISYQCPQQHSQRNSFYHIAQFQKTMNDLFQISLMVSKSN